MTEALERPATGFVPFDASELEQSIASRFAQQVARHPDRAAVKTPQRALSYAQLDCESDRVAAALRRSLGDRDVPVALLFEQGTALVAAILGVLKAGQLYLALDAAHPKPRLAAMLEDSRAPLILTDEAHHALATEFATNERRVCNVDQIEAESPSLPPTPPLSPDRLAYLFYTSGSTGAPKGVCDTQRNVLHNILRYTNSLEIGPEDRLTLLQSCAFSGSVSSLFGALLNGACVYPIDLHRDAMDAVARWLIDERITLYHSVPALFERLLATGRAFPSLRVIRLEGDQCAPRHVALFRERFGAGALLVNGLGATETGLTRQLFVRADAPFEEAALVPIGYATQDMEARLLDEAGDAVAPGEVGEIAIRSRYLAHGYWRDPKRTRAAFRPCRDAPGLREYRTGDMGRLRADGCLEYLGRRHADVKINGERVSIPALEHALGSLPGIEVAAVAPRGPDDERRLTAYLVASSSPAPTVSALRRALAERFQRPMIPSAFVVLDALPLDANGKLDRGALPAPPRERPLLDVAYAAPETETQRRTAEIWQEVLDLPRVGIHDDFFELGGDSLRGVDVLTRIDRRFCVSLPHAVWFEAPNVALMASAIEADRPSQSLVPLAPEGSLRPFYFVHAHFGQVLDYGNLARCMDPERPIFALQAHGLDGRGEHLTSIEAMASHYVGAIRSADAEGPYLLGGYCFGGLVALEMAQQLLAAGQRVDFLALVDPDPVAAPGSRAPVPPEPLGARLRRHTRRLAEMEAGPAAGYVGVRVRNIVRAIPGQLRRRGMAAAWRLSGFRRRYWPRSLRNSGFATLYTDAANRYEPQPYAGRAALFYGCAPGAEADAPDGGWGELIAGDFELCRIPCRRHLILVEPNVRHLAAQLSERLASTGS